MAAIVSLKQKNKNEKLYSHTEYSQENASDSFLFSTATDFILDVFYEICEVLQNLIFTEESWRLLPISSNISDISLALLAINQHSLS